MSNNRWQFWIDVGGTFTDCFAVDPKGVEHQLKVLSSGTIKGHARFVAPDCVTVPDQPAVNGFWNGALVEFHPPGDQTIFNASIVDHVASQHTFKLDQKCDHREILELPYQIHCGLTAPIVAIHILTGTPINRPLNSCDVYLGTTKGTNALLTRTGAKTALITSTGLRDFLLIGDQTRPRLFDLTIRKPEPLFDAAIAIDERTLADGSIETPIDEDKVRKQLTRLKSEGFESIAVCLIHGFRFPAHEQSVKRIACDIGFREVRTSFEVAPLIKLIPRGETTVLDAYLNPVISDYLDSIQSSLGCDSNLQLITSAGVLSDRHQFSGKDSVLSGPAGGVVGAAGIARQIGFDKCIGFDMGGTSTDVARFDGNFELQYESVKAGIQIISPMMSIETVAAGGGSICDFDGTRLTVGPKSAGASPGPACYGSGGPLTVTDINLFLGRLDERQFPFPLQIDSVIEKLTQLADRISTTGTSISNHDLATGYLKIANHNMASAIRTVSVKRGFDPREYLMVSFGGAGSQHCCAVADELDIEQILVHPKSSILSAFGIRLADQSYSAAHSILASLSDSSLEEARINAKDITKTLVEKFSNQQNLSREWSVDLRFEGTQNSINVPLANDTHIRDCEFIEAAFHSEHQRQYGYTQKRSIELVCVRASVIQTGHRLTSQETSENLQQAHPVRQSEFFSGRSVSNGSFYDWAALEPGAQIAGPSIIADALTSIVVDEGWEAVLGADRQVLVKKTDLRKIQQDDRESSASASDPIELEIFYSSFRSIAEQMGVALRNTAISVNVKERLDFSCALFSASGDLVVNAPHIPVHLGAMSEAVKATIKLNSNIGPGDVFITNDPYAGGSHLPDVTVLTPFFDNDNRPVMWLANRAHHAEIGGIAPGSMPAHATRLEEEGVLIENFQIVKAGQDQFDALEQLLCESRFPSRSPDENLADIRAQIAANKMGGSQLQELIQRFSLMKVLAYTAHIRTAASTKTREVLRKINDFDQTFEDQMDDGTKICVSMVKIGDHLSIDFTGSDGVHSGNLNANASIVSSAILYVLRCLINEDIPLNSGVLDAITINIPENCFLNPTSSPNKADSPAVVGGNVETSQRIVDVLLGCFELAAASQGTMNNWLVGDENFGYYETVGGGSGATSDGPGADAIHCHMSNTRLTDPEILETRYPMIVREFAIRNESGGEGHHDGGNGMIREIEFTKALTLSVLGNRRTTKPFGMQGGESGLPGRATLQSPSQTEVLGSQCEREVGSGDRLRLITPGGGGFGKRE